MVTPLYSLLISLFFAYLLGNVMIYKQYIDHVYFKQTQTVVRLITVPIIVNTVSIQR